MSNHDLAKSLYVNDGKSVTDIAAALGVSRTTIYAYKNKDLANGVDWDELRFLKATDSRDAQRNEEDFLALLIHNFEQALEKLNDCDPAEQVATLSKYAGIYYKIKSQRDNPKVTKADVAKKVLQRLSELALDKEASTVIDFLSKNADQIVKAALEA
ncbi:hypothetical protein AB835_04695 [Candidatus Endobugula sertula]|uniref:Uncharacterized protein n=1 Tax=Candidatus Endobugula sertula TaxID=62101 RepID=A0A1D2QRG6_9GAMM|nr:hypothetical protein AB835_04695 [Candidatus Endobugula sertula]